MFRTGTSCTADFDDADTSPLRLRHHRERVNNAKKQGTRCVRQITKNQEESVHYHRTGTSSAAYLTMDVRHPTHYLNIEIGQTPSKTRKKRRETNNRRSNRQGFDTQPIHAI